MQVDLDSTMGQEDRMSEIVWRPTPERIETANVTRLMRRHGIADAAELVRRSTADTDWFWRAALEDQVRQRRKVADGREHTLPP